MKKKTVLVTGSSRGIGLAIAQKFAAVDCNVVFNCVSRKLEMEKAIDDLQARNQNLLGIVADVSDYAQAENLFAQIRRSFGDVDILINNAGIEYFGLFHEMSPGDWEHVIRTNLYSVMHCSHLALPRMIARKDGIIVNISSVWGNAGASCEAVYAASKAGVNAFTKSLAKELGPSHIRVNAVACGAIETEMNARLSEDEKNAFMDQIPYMRFGKGYEVAELVYFLSTEQSSYLTGQVIGLDGGLF